MSVRGGRSPETATAPVDHPTVLLLAAQADRREFAAFYREQYATVFRYAYRRVLCPEIAADLAAESFALALHRMRQFDHRRGTATQWLYGIVRNQVRMWARRGEVDRRARQRIGIVTPTFTEADTKMIDDRHDAGPLVAALRQVLKEMRSSDREIIELRVVDNLSYEAIGERLDLAAPTARVRCSRALARLRAELERRVPDLDGEVA
jgi:RNA polymerase sigma factor (sigma-70 family)